MKMCEMMKNLASNTDGVRTIHRTLLRMRWMVRRFWRFAGWQGLAGSERRVVCTFTILYVSLQNLPHFKVKSPEWLIPFTIYHDVSLCIIKSLCRKKVRFSIGQHVLG